MYSARDEFTELKTSLSIKTFSDNSEMTNKFISYCHIKSYTHVFTSALILMENPPKHFVKYCPPPCYCMLKLHHVCHTSLEPTPVSFCMRFKNLIYRTLKEIAHLKIKILSFINSHDIQKTFI